MKTKIFEWCAFVARPDRDPNPFARTVLQAIKVITPALFEKQCPYEDRLDFVNLKFPKKFTFILPNGQYQYKNQLIYPKPSPANVSISIIFEIF